MNSAFEWTNDILAFLLELAALAALGYWGFKIGQGVILKIVLGIGTPALAAVLWGLFAAPHATFAVPLVAVLAVKALVFGSAAAALYAVGPRATGVAFAVIAAVNTAIVTWMRSGGDSGPGAG